MPINEYRCQGCEHVFEDIRTMGDDGSGLSCPECDTARLKRIPSTFASVIKGSSKSSGSSSSSCGSCTKTSCQSCSV